MRKKKWIQKAIKRKGALRAKAKRAGALKDGISAEWLAKRKATLQKKADVGTLSKEELRTLRQINLAQRLKRMPKRGRKKK